ncbi:hypothetical protein HDU99_006202, partial [Rhizoclosmatium hyalinum]
FNDTLQEIKFKGTKVPYPLAEGAPVAFLTGAAPNHGDERKDGNCGKVKERDDAGNGLLRGGNGGKGRPGAPGAPGGSGHGRPNIWNRNNHWNGQNNGFNGYNGYNGYNGFDRSYV